MTDFVKLMSGKSELFRIMNDTAKHQREFEREQINDYHGQSYSYHDDEALRESERDEVPEVPKIKFWTMTGGKQILISQMTDSHLKNTINCLIRPNGLERCRQHPTFQALEFEAKKRGLKC